MQHFLQRYFRQRGEDPPPISEGVTQAFMRYAWPGNVRELENTCERMAQTNTCGTLRTGCVAAGIMFRATGPMPPNATIEAVPGPPAPMSLDARIRDLETELIAWALRVSDGNKSRAAELLQINRSTLNDRIHRYQIDRAEAPHLVPADAAASA